ncbi:GNAT family N-acetyltransferase [Priestia flexa]|uniref:GNAT family N-acetyltransferase n=1 Tax=Priestia flexa TaxID=86664 RepID=UPI001B321263|nr:GNAT family N-acetyltransferase [Priestia flexa]
MVVIRRVVEKDVERLATLMKEYIVDFYHQPEPPRKEIVSHIELVLADPSKGVQYVAEEQNRLLGFATIYVTFSTLKLKKTAILNDLYVLPMNRGNKVGEKLFQSCETYVKEHDLVGLSWETATENEVAQNFYKKMGGEKSRWLHYEK